MWSPGGVLNPPFDIAQDGPVPITLRDTLNVPVPVATVFLRKQKKETLAVYGKGVYLSDDQGQL